MTNISNTKIHDLFNIYLGIALRQDIAVHHYPYNTQLYNKLFDQRMAVLNALRMRDNDGRRALIPLMSHDNIQVRFLAATDAAHLAPEEAKTVLRSMVDQYWFFHNGDARRVLEEIERGTHDADWFLKAPKTRNLDR